MGDAKKNVMSTDEACAILSDEFACVRCDDLGGWKASGRWVRCPLCHERRKGLARTVVALHVENERLRGLLDAAPKLMPPADGGPDLLDRVDTIVAMTAEIMRLGAIIEGRTTRPTYPEINAHALADGKWLVRYERDGAETTTQVREFEGARWDCTTGSLAHRWWPLDKNGRPCAWPTVPAEGSAP